MERLLFSPRCRISNKIHLQGGKNFAQSKPIVPYAFFHAERNPAHYLVVDGVALRQNDTPRGARVIAAMAVSHVDVRVGGGVDRQGLGADEWKVGL